MEAQWTASERGRERFTCEQPPYSILVRGIEADTLPTCARYGMGVIPYSPLAGGWLTGRYRKGSESGPFSVARQRLDVELPDDVLDRIDEIVPPGVTINPADNGWASPALRPAARRR
ncbi:MULTISPECIES: aldo/keto reductase [unclassified Nonomuraea]|uniref:aldo/keto reductase n=1 Tax=unclassified Nonomuraea TaxID=2593643 RepID=UPI0033E25371